MDEAKRKKLEAKLHQLLVQSDQTRDEEIPAPYVARGARVIRRRKGNPDLHIA